MTDATAQAFPPVPKSDKTVGADNTVNTVSAVSAVAADTPTSAASVAAHDPVAGDKPVVAEIKPEDDAFPRWPMYVIALGTTLALLKFGQSFLVPVVIAVLIFYALVLAVDTLEKFRVPRGLGAALVVIALISVTSLTVYAVWAQLDRIAEAVPRAVLELKTRWGQMKYDRGSTLSKLQGSAEAVQRAMSGDAAVTPPTPRARVAPPAPAPAPPAATGAVERLFWTGTVTALEFLSTLAAIYLLAYFLLVDGDHFRRRAVSFVGKALSTKRVTVQALDAIDHSIRRYLAMLVATNTILGLLTYVALLIVGVEDAAGWGVLAALLHVIPYFGPMLVAGGVFVTALHQLGDLHSAVYAALATVVVAVAIGTFAQTWMTARIVKMNASVVFVSILLFGSLWGGAGLLLAVPIAVIIKVVLGAVPSLNPLAELLGDGRRDT